MMKNMVCLHGAMPEIEYRNLFFDALPEGLKNKRMLLATDIHYGGLLNSERMARITDGIIALKPDIIMLGGDYADNIKNETEFLENHLPKLQAPLGVYCVPGNNDWETVNGEYDKLRGMFARAGAALLVNERATREVSGGRLVVTGIDDGKCGTPDKKCLERGNEGSDFNVLLSHSPAVIDDMLDGLKTRFQLVLCGHTHAGQICIGKLSPYTVGYEARRVGKRKYFFVSGIHEVDGMTIVVSNGIGCSILPLRIGAPPKIHLFTLKVRV